MKKAASIATVIALAFSASIARADHVFEDYARVIEVTPQYEKVNRPREVCETGYIPEREHRRSSTAAFSVPRSAMAMAAWLPRQQAQRSAPSLATECRNEDGEPTTSARSDIAKLSITGRPGLAATTWCTVIMVKPEPRSCPTTPDANVAFGSPSNRWAQSRISATHGIAELPVRQALRRLAERHSIGDHRSQ